jgi:hypothetical protein
MSRLFHVHTSRHSITAVGTGCEIGEIDEEIHWSTTVTSPYRLDLTVADKAQLQIPFSPISPVSLPYRLKERVTKLAATRTTVDNCLFRSSTDMSARAQLVLPRPPSFLNATKRVLTPP